ncbi:unnamed protein product [Orchesella dallaii]|uniref:Uncharacterized protein n=1 Tax=Orchesella dallaii TaxID=48710 RepID=A0ABP1S5J5_9HEXA
MTVTPRGSSSSQVWLTYVLTDLGVPKAQTLFDFLFYLEDELNTSGLNNEDFFKLSAFTLKCFSKFVFLEPTMFAVKNSNDIFDNYDVASGLQTTVVEQPGTDDVDDGLSIFVAHPYLQVFRALMKSFQTRNGAGVESYLRVWTTNNLPSTVKPLDMKYSGKLSINQCKFLRNESDISLVNIDVPFEKQVLKILDYVHV